MNIYAVPYAAYVVHYVVHYVLCCTLCTMLNIGKDPDAGKDWWQKEKKAEEGEMVRWHHQLNGHEFE